MSIRENESYVNIVGALVVLACIVGYVWDLNKKITLKREEAQTQIEEVAPKSAGDGHDQDLTLTQY